MQDIEVPELEESPDITSRLWTPHEVEFVRRYCRKDPELVTEHLNRLFGNNRSYHAVEQKMRIVRDRG